MSILNNEYMLARLYKEESMHAELYRKLSIKENNPELKSILNKLYNFENNNKKLWETIVKKHIGYNVFLVNILMALFIFVKYTLGISMAIKMIEYREISFHKKLDEISMQSFDKKRRSILNRIEKNQRTKEEPFENSIIKKSNVIKNIRDVTFGMNDGLVEVLAATVGLGAALQNPILVLVGGLIIAVSGTLSMTGGAYISTDYEENVNINQKRSVSKARISAIYVGVFYFLGAIFPLLPFILGYSGFIAILLSIIVTTIVLSIVATIIAIITNVSITKKVGMTLGISLGAAFGTIVLGYLARYFFNINA